LYEGKTRVVYVENDPALRGILSSQLEQRAEISLTGSFSSSEEALRTCDYKKVDVALLDLALGSESLNGTELAMLMREQNPHIGIVIYSQHNAPNYLNSLSDLVRWGWSYVEKRGDGKIDNLVDILISTSKGRSTIDVSHPEQSSEESVISQLSLRQRQIMSLAATGLDANAIAKELQLAPITIRQELSRCYAILVPNPSEGTDLRTSAVLKYLREVRRDGEI
jgi:DNA-binding NarL/FixJ family response regulator